MRLEITSMIQIEVGSNGPPYWRYRSKSSRSRPRLLNSFSFCHWNLNSIAACNFIKMSLLQTYKAIHRFDIIYLSETYLNNSLYTDDDDQLAFSGYNLIRADNANNTKRGGVCIYYRKFLPVKIINVNILNECLICELSFGSRRVYQVSIYRIPSQSSSEYDAFLLNFEQLLTYLNNIKHMLLVTGDFNVRFSSWWSDDIDTIEGTRLESTISYYGLYQIINEPTQILQSSASCIDVMFTNQPNLVINSGVHPSLHQNWPPPENICSNQFRSLLSPTL